MKEAWDAISAEMVVKLFKKCCSSNKLDVAEVDANSSDCHERDFSDSDICTDVYDDVPMMAKDLDELFGKFVSESEFEGF